MKHALLGLGALALVSLLLVGCRSKPSRASADGAAPVQAQSSGGC